MDSDQLKKRRGKSDIIIPTIKRAECLGDVLFHGVILDREEVHRIVDSIVERIPGEFLDFSCMDSPFPSSALKKLAEGVQSRWLKLWDTKAYSFDPEEVVTDESIGRVAEKSKYLDGFCLSDCRSLKNEPLRSILSSCRTNLTCFLIAKSNNFSDSCIDGLESLPSELIRLYVE